MPKKLSITLTEEQLKSIQTRIKNSGLTYVSIARQLKNDMCEASCLKKLRGDTPLSDKQLKSILDIIKRAEIKREKLNQAIIG